MRWFMRWLFGPGKRFERIINETKQHLNPMDRYDQSHWTAEEILRNSG